MEKWGVREDLYNLASDLVWSAETVEDMRAARNILIINDLRARLENSFFEFEQVDSRLREEYPLIEMLEQEIERSNIGQNEDDGNGKREKRDLFYGTMEGMTKDARELHLQKLDADTRGIYADVLLRHRQIQCLQEFVSPCITHTNY